MAIVKGYVARYDIPGIRISFMKGCFDKNSGFVVPVTGEYEFPKSPNVIGNAQLFPRTDGLYAEADVDLDKISYLPRSIGFFGNFVEYGEEPSQVKSILIRSISLLRTDNIKTSSIESIETNSQ